MLNRHLLGVQGGHVVSLALRFKLTRIDAIELCAWILLMCEAIDPETDPIASVSAALEAAKREGA